MIKITISGGPGEGKTTIAALVAQALENEGIEASVNDGPPWARSEMDILRVQGDLGMNDPKWNAACDFQRKCLDAISARQEQTNEVIEIETVQTKR